MFVVAIAMQAANWVEYAAAVKDHGSFLYTQGQKQYWYEVFMLDVAAIWALGGLVAWRAIQFFQKKREVHAKAKQQRWSFAGCGLHPHVTAEISMSAQARKGDKAA